MSSIIKVDTVQDTDGNNIINENANTITIGASGDTITIPSGATLANAGTVTGIPASAIDSGTIATARLGSGTASSSTFLRGDQTYATPAGGTNTPAFSAERSGAQTVSNETRTTILFNNEFYDSSSAYDTSTGKFTPQVAGKYFINANIGLDAQANDNYYWGFIELYKNSTFVAESQQDQRNGGAARTATATVTCVVDMNGSSDFVLIQGYISASSNGNILSILDTSTFSAFKIIE